MKRPPSREGLTQISAHFTADVIKAIKVVAVDQGRTQQSLLAEAVNDLLEKYGKDRLAREEALPRGGAARQRN
ncbi:UNVERIFIED_ORG: putative amino acid racemase [Rhizobium sp. SORGH_AS260]|uniref:ribbon-helix-helix domain-containing protein n=1 Tax=Agrobacterium sp. SORGH_AS_0440 TaxID=3041757 RepID=UPI0013AED28F|nr:ribbon-helix-helix domain-containing protein [Agrobacterium sp. SORGH_AS_0440]MDP9734521.1 putative amino acid racemase [Rhizobium sp. SORGH_AS_0285]MDP9756740.1 putative amino acid racemase [Rhizobium sp. SORGH_AS_0260]MDR6084009.1 putative amino acid racemase [Agrobacterium sp. SORGH_AS_0440]